MSADKAGGGANLEAGNSRGGGQAGDGNVDEGRGVHFEWNAGRQLADKLKDKTRECKEAKPPGQDKERECERG